MIRKITLLSILVFLVLTGCQKELSHESGNTPTPPQPVSLDSNYLSKFYFIDSSNTGIDTTDRWIYVYDNLKRVVSFTDSSNGFYVVPEKHIYSYTGSDTLPYKSIIYYTGPLGDTIETWHYYDNTGRMIKDSSISRFNTLADYVILSTIGTYTYAPGKIYGLSNQTQIYSSGSNYTLYKKIDTATLNAGGNIISNKKYVYDINPAIFLDFTLSTATYDNHPSPFAKLSNFKCFFMFPTSETFFQELPQNNNLLHMYEVTTGANSHLYDGDNFTGLYQYNNAGYPSQIRIPDTLNLPNVSKIVFTYKAL